MDLLIEDGKIVHPVEIKHGASVGQYDTAGLRHCMADLGIAKGYPVTRGDQVRRLGNGITCLPWAEIVRGAISPWAVG